MDRRLRYVIILAVCIILGNQFIHLYRLYQEEKTQYLHWYNNIITGAVYQFNMKSSNNNDIVSYNESIKKLIYRINQKTISFQLNEKDDIRQISEVSDYDIRNSESWTLKNFYTLLQTKLDSVQLKTLALQFVIGDSTGQIKDSYPGHHGKLPSSPEYHEPLGFISGDTLYATYNYPAILFIQVAIWPIILTIIISALFIICIVNFYRTIRNEKKSGEYRESFIDNLVHDLKRPVGNQIKACYLLPTLPPDEQESFLEDNRKQLNEMLQSINRMLLQSTDAHGLQLNVKEFNLKETLEALKQKDRWNTQNKQFDIDVDFRSDNPIITGDYHFLFAVFQNLVDNALKYSGDQVKIQITCTDQDAQHVLIQIEDNGFGIPLKNLKHVFERYIRGDHQGNKKIKVHGLGLHYARIVIRAHGGKIDIQSEEGKGTTLFVTLPRKAKIKNKYKQ